MDKPLDFDIIGVAEALRRHKLAVPLNQREYSWQSEAQVSNFLQDINNAIRNKEYPYFLGTIVLTKGDNDTLAIVDGQQRLATTTMILAAIRDWAIDKGEMALRRYCEENFLFKMDLDESENVPQLKLNVDDNEFFRNFVLEPKHNKVKQLPVRRSHRLIEAAFVFIKEYFAGFEKSYGAQTIEALKEWIKYLEKHANVLKLVVSNAENAFMMFETLNDRGLKTTQADMVKNHLFETSDNRLTEAQRLWSSMKGAIEAVSNDDDDITMDFLKAICCIVSGVTPEKEVMKVIQSKTKNKTDCIVVLTLLEELSKDYSAILNPDAQKWNEYNPDVRKSIQAINLFGGVQIRPLMLAISKYFSKKDASVAFRKLVAWSVRFMIAGVRGGKIDTIYSKYANKIYNGEIKNEQQLKESAVKDVIGDAEFKIAFETAKVKRATLARYYLRALEITAQEEPQPEFIPNDSIDINLEHILPSSPAEHWSNLNPQDIETHYSRLGNFALLAASKNSDIGNMAFDTKKETYSKSTFILTRQLSELNKWDAKEIDNRQKIMAELAVKTWPL